MILYWSNFFEFKYTVRFLTIKRSVTVKSSWTIDKKHSPPQPRINSLFKIELTQHKLECVLVNYLEYKKAFSLNCKWELYYLILSSRTKVLFTICSKESGARESTQNVSEIFSEFSGTIFFLLKAHKYIKALSYYVLKIEAL